jgi:uroporphyrinogen-III synthase
MPLPLAGRVIALAETRQLEELAAMIEKEGATPLRIPMVAMRDAPDPGPVLAWLRELIADHFAFVVFMTGEGVRRLYSLARKSGLESDLVAALGRTGLVIRGPKPAAALKEIGLKADHVAGSPTTDGLIATLKGLTLTGRSVGVILHGAENAPLVDFLRGAGATVSAVQPYVYAPGADAESVAGLIEKMAQGSVDLLVITSSPQVERLFEVASQRGLDEALKTGFAKTRVAAVGPVAAHTLGQHGVRVAVCPDQGFVMKKLVQLISRDLSS